MNIFLTLALLIPAISAAAVEFAGDEVNINAGDGFEYFYTLTSSCQGPANAKWTKVVTVDIISDTPDDADLVLAIGTDDAYFAAAIAYEGDFVTVVIGNGEEYGGGAVLAPKDGNPLFATPAGQTLDTMWQTSGRYSWRGELIPSGSVDEWDIEIESASSIAANTSPLVITIEGDRDADSTVVTIEKNGVTLSQSYTSTWRANDNPLLYLGADRNSLEENFILTGFFYEETCQTERENSNIDQDRTSSGCGFCSNIFSSYDDYVAMCPPRGGEGPLARQVAVNPIPEVQITEQFADQVNLQMVLFVVCITSIINAIAVAAGVCVYFNSSKRKSYGRVSECEDEEEKL